MTLRKKVAIQGIEGSYHEIAARDFFGSEEIDLVECDSFRELVTQVAQNRDLLGMMAIENTIAGSLLQNHELLRASGLRIVGEYKLRISHSLATLPETRIDEITEVDSHPMALLQCADFLETMPSAVLVEKKDTASSARWIAEQKLRGHAAICSRQAARTYGLKLLSEGIESDRHNFTRFLLLAHPEAAHTEDQADVVGEKTKNKVSLVFSLQHAVGSLSEVLIILSFYGMNLTKIQSFPLIGKEWQYLFYVDFTFSDYARYKQALNAVLPLSSDLSILGEYPEWSG